MERQTGHQAINNDFYEELGEKWFTANDHPIALLRAENAVRIPWILGILETIGKNQTVLDIGCGAGFLTNALSKAEHQVFGIDLSQMSLQLAQKTDATQKAVYQFANAYSLPYPDQMFDVVCAMDLLEHVEEPALVISEASRVLKRGGLFFFHTFNRNFLSYLLIIKGVEWRISNAPKNMHTYPLFIKPYEMREFCLQRDLQIVRLQGFRPTFFHSAFWKMLFTKKVPQNFSFRFSKSLLTGYCGYAKKEK